MPARVTDGFDHSGGTQSFITPRMALRDRDFIFSRAGHKSGRSSPGLLCAKRDDSLSLRSGTS